MLYNGHVGYPFDKSSLVAIINVLPARCSTYLDVYTLGPQAATTIARLLKEFRSLQFGILVGIGGGIPVEGQHDIRQGEVVVGKARGQSYAVVQFDRGSSTPEFPLIHGKNLRRKHKNQGYQISEFLSQRRLP